MRIWNVPVIVAGIILKTMNHALTFLGQALDTEVKTPFGMSVFKSDS